MTRPKKRTEAKGNVNILRIAREAGLNPIECPFCHHKVKTGGAVEALFKGVLKSVRQGYLVFVPKFGAWYPRLWKGRAMNTPRFPDLKWVGPRHTVAWRMGKGVSEYMNGQSKRVRRMNEAAREMGNADQD